MHSTKLLLVVQTLICIALCAATTDLFTSDIDRGYVRTKKKIYFKKPYNRGNERLTVREAPKFHHSSSDEYPYVYTSESPSSAWKPISYTVVPEYRVKDVSLGVHSKVGHIHHGKTTHLPKEHIIYVESEHPHKQKVPSGNPPYNNYALLHYYVPFEPVTLAQSKPIEEPLEKLRKKPITIQHIVKANIEPIRIYTSSTSTTTQRPRTLPTPPIYENTADTENEKFAGSYEYEYFVRDNHHGTNFGHKEYRDGKSTKGDYEVVLPDNRIQHVQYWSDESGYHATVTYHPLYSYNKH